MDADQLRTVQAPLKEQYRAEPGAAMITLHAAGDLDDSDVVCSVQTGQALVAAGLHPATGGDGSLACSATCSCRRSSRARASRCDRSRPTAAST